MTVRRLVPLSFVVATLFIFAFYGLQAKTLPPLNFIHITDLHGWIFGHPHTPELNADFGDFASLLEWMQADAAARGEEFFVFDSGDLIEGTGLSDATQIHGQYILEAVKQVKDYTSLTIGNHDIGHNNVINLMQSNFIPFWNGRYLTANSLMKDTMKFIGQPYYTFTTQLGTKVLVLGYLYNFTQEANETVVVPVEISITQPYFKAAMAEPDVDLIVVIAHIDPTEPPELTDIYKAIRKYHPNKPLALFSGHRHILYYQQYDPSAFTLESGKYFEVLGHVKFNVDPNTQHFANFSYEFVKTTKDNLYQLAGKDETNFLTPRGAALRQFISATYNKLGLNKTLGCSPITYSPDTYVKSNDSLYGLYINNVVPDLVFNSSFTSNFYIMNTGTLRYDMYQGRVCVNDIYSMIPFGDVFQYVQLDGTTLKAVIAFIEKGGLQGLWHNHRVPYIKDNKRALRVALGLEDSPPPFYYSFIPIDPSTLYTVVLAQYDTYAVGKALQALFPGKQYPVATYPTPYSSTAALSEYIMQYLPCSASCSC